jgi:hypothetical protein
MLESLWDYSLTIFHARIGRPTMRPHLAATVLRTLWLVVCVVFPLPLVIGVGYLLTYLPVGGATAFLAISAVAIVGAWAAVALAAALMLRRLSRRRFAASAMLTALLAASGTLGVVRGMCRWLGSPVSSSEPRW